MFYGFILTMWKTGKVDERYLDKAVSAKRITAEEKNKIMLEPKY